MLKTVQYATAIGALVLALAFVGVSAWRSFQQQPHETDNRASAEKTESKTNDVPVPQSAENAIARYNLWLAIFTGVLALVALIQIGFLLSADRTASNAALAAKASADATRDYVTLAKNTAHRQLRAYVTVKQVNENAMTDRDGAHTGWGLAVEWQNTGSTPTRDLEIWVTGKFFQPDIPAGFDFARPDIARLVTGVIGPNASITSGDVFVPLESAEKTLAGDGKLYLWGRIEYNDVFDGTSRHHTDFRTEVTVIRDPRVFTVGWAPFGFRLLKATDD